ncbi:MAG: TIR domain-containing protein [Bacteroidales bacterium]|nr:TIR domain-containing protein [Bacteroidales bacterium]
MKYDVFISHASEDKVDCVNQLAKSLIKLGLSVWYDNFTLKLGDSLNEEINKGLSQSTYGIVVLSPDFFIKKWTQLELNGLMSQEENEKTILPIWHKVSKHEVQSFSPILADKLAVSTSEGMEKVVKEIIKVVDPSKIAEIHFKAGQRLEKENKREEAESEYLKVLDINHYHSGALKRFTQLSSEYKQHNSTSIPDLIQIINKTSNYDIFKGTVKWFNEVKGFGFIAPSVGSSDVFVHINSVKVSGYDNLIEGEHITYSLETQNDKTYAVNISK